VLCYVPIHCKQDAESEASVQKALDQLMQQGVGGTTIVLVAHRLSTVIGADSIAVMHDGQIVEVGTHRELLKVSMSCVCGVLTLYMLSLL
jgi:ABC-type multidrug transport system fused ATPase/permease subunit